MKTHAVGLGVGLGVGAIVGALVTHDVGLGIVGPGVIHDVGLGVTTEEYSMFADVAERILEVELDEAEIFVDVEVEG